MVQALLVVLIALTFGFIFAKLDTLTKTNKIVLDELSQLKRSIEDISNNNK